jgi:hypothetical protein
VRLAHDHTFAQDRIPRPTSMSFDVLAQLQACSESLVLAFWTGPSPTTQCILTRVVCFPAAWAWFAQFAQLASPCGDEYDLSAGAKSAAIGVIKLIDALIPKRIWRTMVVPACSTG